MLLSAAPTARQEVRQWHGFTWFEGRLGDEQVERLAIHVPVRLAGLPGEHRLQLDTGASHTVLHGGALRAIDPTFAADARTLLVSGTIAGATVTNEPVGVLPDFRASVAAGTPAPIIGTLGLSFFSQRMLVVDYPAARLMVLPKDATLPDQLERRARFLPTTVRNGKLYVPVAFDGRPRTDVFLDTGASAFALVTSPARWRELTGLQGTESSNLRRTGSSWDTDLTLVGARMAGRLAVGPATLHRPVVWHTPDPRFSFDNWPDTSGFIGNALFADRFVVVLDLPRGRIGLAASTAARPRSGGQARGATSRPPNASARDARGELSAGTAARIEQHMRVLAHARMRGRLSGTKEFARAARYVADVLRRQGASPVLGDDLLAPFAAHRTTAQRIVLEVHGETPSARVPTQQLCVLPGAGPPLTPHDLVLREVRSAEPGDPHVGWSESGPMPGTTGIAGELSARHGEKRRVAEAAGAVAVLILQPDPVDSPEWRGRRTWCEQGELRLSTSGPAVPVIFSSAEASSAVRAAPQASKVRLHVERSSRPHRGLNIIARVGPVSQEAVVVTAHLDHLGKVVDNDGRHRIAPGAVDNASGVAALLELARRLATAPPVGRAVILAATDAEEAGLVGSTALIDQLRAAGVTVVANLNIDGATLMQHPLVDLVALGGRDSQLGEVAVAAGRAHGVEVALEHLPVGGSDHFPFALARVPAVWLVAGTETGVSGLDGRKVQARWMSEFYHSPRDSMDQPLDYAAAARLVDVLESMLRRLTRDAEPPPAWNRGTVWAAGQH